MRRFISFLLFFISMTSASALPLNDNLLQFDIKKANDAFDHINLQLSIQNVNVANLNAAIITLSKLTANADQCINDTEKKLTNLEILIKQASDGSVPVPAAKTTAAIATPPVVEGADRVYLAKSQSLMSARQAECRLFSIRAKEAIDTYKAAIAKLNEKETLTKRSSLWVILGQIATIPPTSIIQPLQTEIPSIVVSPYLWVSLIVLALALASTFLSKIRKIRFVRHALHLKKLRLSHVLLLSACIISGTVFILLSFLQQDSDPTSLVTDIAQQLFFYFLSCVLIIIFLKIRRVRAILFWYNLNVNFYRAVLMCLISFYAASIIGSTFARAVQLNPIIWQLVQSLFLLTMLSCGIYFAYYFCHTHRDTPIVKHHHHLIQRLTTLVFIAYAIIDILGYHSLAMSLTLSGLATFALVFLTILIVQAINKSYFMLNHQQDIHNQIIKYFGYKKEQVFTEFLILKSTLQLIVIALGIYLIVHSWGFASYFFANAYTQILHGVHLANTTIYPTRIVLGVLAYCVMYLFFRGVSTTISRHRQFEDEEETQVAIASILTYIGFALALITALLVAGFNFTGLAIVAGALSVGIGLGLQSVVNNFVCGLILLIEKPIQAGDRIRIDGNEGFVKKIRVRSTHIITPAFEDIIVPNADLISKCVTNYVYSNKQCSIECDLTIPNGSDTQLMRELLLQAANSHEDVIKTGRNKPYVLFRAFGEKGLVFQLCCLIKDVNKKRLVQSDLNFTINQLLRDNKI